MDWFTNLIRLGMSSVINEVEGEVTDIGVWEDRSHSAKFAFSCGNCGALSNLGW